jgi:hypothetical protein
MEQLMLLAALLAAIFLRLSATALLARLVLVGLVPLTFIISLATGRLAGLLARLLLSAGLAVAHVLILSRIFIVAIHEQLLL